jgi:hypothetical protein
MAKVYFPTHGVDVAASAPHPANTHYRVSRGVEHWEGGIETHKVIKVQMVYDGTVSGRRSPSFPVGSDDAKRVMKAIEEVEKGGGKTLRGEASSG